MRIREAKGIPQCRQREREPSRGRHLERRGRGTSDTRGPKDGRKGTEGRVVENGRREEIEMRNCGCPRSRKRD